MDLGQFIVSTVIGGFGLLFSLLAFIEARRAKKAAGEAGRVVKIQTVTLDLTEINQKLSRLSPDIQFDEARDLLAEISRRIRRITSPFKDDSDLSSTIAALKTALNDARNSLKEVRPTNPSIDPEVPRAVYNAIESHFATIAEHVADLTGLFESITTHVGDNHARRR